MNELYRRGVQETKAVSRYQLQATEEYGPGNEDRAQRTDRLERAGESSVQSVAMWKYACVPRPDGSPRFLGPQEGRELK